MTRRWWAVPLAAALAASAGDAGAFCGFYVSGADTKLSNDATQVVLMRDGTRTVLSMQNDYQGPPQDFAMVIPVPVVLQKENVKTLTKEVFDHVDQLTAPRLVEYWEQDPCPRPMMAPKGGSGRGMVYPAAAAPVMHERRAEAVRIEAQFSVGEYDIVVLSATDSTALDTWLHQNGYKIPAGAEPYLRPYVQMGMKFFVAKVDVSKVKFERVGSGPEHALLSPLRFHYDSDAFELPIRLGLINSSGTQDLVVTVLARNQRYEVANYDNVAIPTNVDVSNATRGEFATFYATLFDQTLTKHPRAVVTEYSWQTTSCDPCPTPPLSDSELLSLGADVLPSIAPPPPPGSGAPIVRGRMRPGSLNDFVVTRLHARYSREALGDDLFFRAAPPIVGGREFLKSDGKLEQGARPDATNNFQARYAIRHPWTGPVACSHPQRGMWGGPPNGSDPGAKAAAKIGFVPRGAAVSMAAFVRGAVPPESFLSSGGATPVIALPLAALEDGGPLLTPQPELDASVSAPVEPSTTVPPTPPPQGGCAGCTTTGAGAGSLGAIVALLGIALARLRRRSR